MGTRLIFIILFLICFTPKNAISQTDKSFVLYSGNKQVPNAKKLDFIFIKKQCTDVKEFKSSNIQSISLKKAEREFIDKYLLDYNLPYAENINEPHFFDYYFLECYVGYNCFYFTLLSKSQNINISRLYLVVANLDNKKVQNCFEVAEQKDYEGYLKYFEVNFFSDKIQVEQHSTWHNNESTLLIGNESILYEINPVCSISKKSDCKNIVIGKTDAIYLEYNKDFSLLIPDFYCDEVDFSKSNPMYKSTVELNTNDTASFQLADAWGIGGYVPGKKIKIVLDTSNTQIQKMRIRAATGIYFNENGNGGLLQQGGSELSDWIELKKTSDSEFLIPNEEELVKMTLISEEDLNKANEKTKKDKNLSFNIRLSNVIIEIDYIQKNKSKKKYIDFSFGYGE
jgi:hypothetical protein